MIALPVLAALLAALPPALAQYGGPNVVTEDPSATSTYPRTVSHCMTLLDTTSHAFVPTNSFTSISTRTINSTSTYHPITTVTPDAITTTGFVTVTETSYTTVYSTPPPFVVPTPNGFRAFGNGDPLLPATTATASAGLSRRLPGKFAGIADIRARHAVPSDVQAGYSLNPNGSLQGVTHVWPRRVHCDVKVIVATTATIVVTGAPVTVTGPQATSTVYGTVTTTVTSTVTSVVPAATTYAACGADNVVNGVREANSADPSNFYAVLYRPFIPLNRQVVTSADTPEACCGDCMRTPNCAGTFWHRNSKTCHISLSIAPTSLNSTLTNGTTITNGTQPFCARGSRTIRLGSVRGSHYFSADKALVVSNGPCGHFDFVSDGA